MYEHLPIAPARSCNWPTRKRNASTTNTSAPSTCCWGLIKEGSGVAANVLKNLDVDLRKIRLEVEKLVQSGPDMVTMGKLPQTPRAKKVIEYAMQEARSLNHNYVGTEHILLGLLREEEGVAAQVLMNLGLKLEEVRQEVLNLLKPASEAPNGPPRAASAAEPADAAIPRRRSRIEPLEQRPRGAPAGQASNGDVRRPVLIVVWRWRGSFWALGPWVLRAGARRKSAAAAVGRRRPWSSASLIALALCRR